MSDAHYWVAHWWPAPAKLNLMLNICGRRDDGYHELQTVFQLLSFCDWINVVPRSDQQLNVSPQIEGVDPEHNLILRAAKLLQAHSGCEQGANIQFRKALPMGAGLGGGSSNAATTLVVLNRMWGLGYSDDQLSELGLQLGADVPVFVRGHSSWAEGVGEVITPLEIPEQWYVVATPSTPVSTAEVFAHEGLTRDSAPITIRAFQEGQTHNDCLSVVRQLNPELDEMFQTFSGHAEVRLTGTGSSLFAACDSREASLELSENLPSNWTKWMVKGINQSPLHEVLKEAPSA